MERVGWGITSFAANDSWVLPIPATFIVDQQGIVRHRFIDPDFRRRVDVETVVSALFGIRG